jgi:hypothetical protein
MTASSPYFMCFLIPTGTIDPTPRALATGYRREVSWCNQVERRWAVASDDHFVVESIWLKGFNLLPHLSLHPPINLHGQWS